VDKKGERGSSLCVGGEPGEGGARGAGGGDSLNASSIIFITKVSRLVTAMLSCLALIFPLVSSNYKLIFIMGIL